MSRQWSIAVADDREDHAELLQVLLTDHGFLVHTYTSGQNLLQGLIAHPPDLILLDIAMPDLDGVAIMQTIRADKALRALPVIAVTAHAMSHELASFLEAGFDDFVVKPVEEPVLLRVVHRWLEAEV